MIVWLLDLLLLRQSVLVTTKAVSLNPADDEVYSIQHYVIKVCQRLVTDRWFPPVSSTNKTDRHYVAEILLEVSLNTISQS